MPEKYETQRKKNIDQGRTPNTRTLKHQNSRTPEHQNTENTEILKN